MRRACESARYSKRESAKDKFLNAQSGINSFKELEPDLNAGLAYAFSSLALYEDFTGVVYEGVVLDNALYYSNEVLNSD